MKNSSSLSVPLTIQDVAKLAGVSTASISHVLNGKGRVSDATAKRIQLLIKTLGYVPNSDARRLALRRVEK
jgi:DNA-binding LacI/PurR family transcriptional regulator